MTQINQTYKCNLCGNVVQVIAAGTGELSCCGQPMVLQNQDEAVETLEKTKENE
ncbi:MAG: hypothetical protein CO003_00385 [Candidatus Portnoybacteria bacterium CG_4_8_14_3_um_filter_44_15]|uniref:Desulfoferrodoxin N-terminal domain-containing protein n=2 Tax=Candidatus Portnoyibacteriota TaxID=1817913 RepID=A0A2M7YLZ3_9BACT|nr:MAG: hypothetical protein CO003_00385 [Candidatus Portnoybacteria bacterium CG_4_8_14_3_um_filter_44_15]PJA64003.1 MAG: hypothetical protein CO160_00925 [Candidatus Portnoybacteria bacterium CG_4_9_14_3_um_filter_43_11]